MQDALQRQRVAKKSLARISWFVTVIFLVWFMHEMCTTDWDRVFGKRTAPQKHTTAAHALRFSFLYITTPLSFV